MKIGRNLIILTIAAILAGIASVYLANSYITQKAAEIEANIRSQYALVDVVVPATDMKAGDILGYSNMVVRQIPKKFLNPNAISPAAFAAVEGRQLASPVGAGDPLLRSHISAFSGGAFSVRVPKGLRALTFPVNTVSSVGGLISPGDHVDLLFTTNSEMTGQPATVPLLTNMKILATGQNYIGANDRGYQDVTFQVTPEQASKILLAQRVGEISTSLRGPNDDTPAFDEAMTPAKLFGDEYAWLFASPDQPTPPTPSTPAPPPLPIQLIIGGTSS